MLVEMTLPSQSNLQQTVQQTLDKVLAFVPPQPAPMNIKGQAVVRVQDIPTILAIWKE